MKRYPNIYLTDRQRIEIALPAWLLMGVIVTDAIALAGDRNEILELLRIAAREPVDDLPASRCARVKRVSAGFTRRFSGIWRTHHSQTGTLGC
jgi:hypothetical protein